MSTLNISELLNSVQNPSNYKWATVPLLIGHEVAIVEAKFLPSRFGGQILKLVFEYQNKLNLGTHVSAIISYTNGYGAVHKSFIDFLKLFYDFSDPDLEINLSDLIGKKCKVVVENQPGKKWQKVSSFRAFEAE